MRRSTHKRIGDIERKLDRLVQLTIEDRATQGMWGTVYPGVTAEEVERYIGAEEASRLVAVELWEQKVAERRQGGKGAEPESA